MGALELTQSKPNLTHKDFLDVYQETVSPEYFSCLRSYGFRASPKSQRKREALPSISTHLRKELAVNKQQAKLSKKQISDTSVYPYCCIGLLLVYFEGELRCGTGSLISKNVVLTAAANIFDKQTQQIATQIRFVLSLDGNHGDIYRISRDKIHFPQQYSQEAEGSHRFNYAFLEIESKIKKQQAHAQQQSDQKPQNQSDGCSLVCDPGLMHGYLGFETSFSGLEPIYVYGFSSQINQEDEIEYRMRGEKISSLVCKDSALGYKMESFSSQVGSPILVRRNEYYQIVGMHMGGKKGLSCGLQFDHHIRHNLNSWLWQSQGSINLTKKKISTNEINLFISLPWQNMVTINLDSNNIICEGLKALTSRAWPMLKQLRLCHNSIAKLNLDPSSLINLQKLYLSFNSIKIVTPIAELPLLKVLDLAANKIDNSDDLYELAYLERLDLSTNRLKHIGNEISKLSKLKKLCLSRNQLISLPMQILRLRNLLTLAIDSNKFKPMPNELISRLQLQSVEVILE